MKALYDARQPKYIFTPFLNKDQNWVTLKDYIREMAVKHLQQELDLEIPMEDQEPLSKFQIPNPRNLWSTDPKRLQVFF